MEPSCRRSTPSGLERHRRGTLTVVRKTCIRSVDRPTSVDQGLRSKSRGRNQHAGTTMARRLAAATKPDSDARVALLDAAEACLHKYGYSGLSTRRVADAAGMPLSQIHYHFGSKEALVLALLDYQN